MRSAGLAVPDAAVRLVTLLVGIFVGLTFLFAFGNVAALGIRLGVPTYVAFLVAPAVDLSIVALLVGTRQLVLHGGPAEVVHAARRLLIFSSTATLALNIAEPLLAGHYGKAAFDAVGPLLLIGWGEVGPRLLHAMQTAEADTRRVDEEPAAPVADGHLTTPAPVDRTARVGMRVRRSPSSGADSEARRQDLRHRARAEDVLHWQQYQRPISAETLRRRLHVGAGTARSLVSQLRADTHGVLDGQVDPATP